MSGNDRNQIDNEVKRFLPLELRAKVDDQLKRLRDGIAEMLLNRDIRNELVKSQQELAEKYRAALVDAGYPKTAEIAKSSWTQALDRIIDLLELPKDQLRGLNGDDVLELLGLKSERELSSAIIKARAEQIVANEFEAASAPKLVICNDGIEIEGVHHAFKGRNQMVENWVLLFEEMQRSKDFKSMAKFSLRTRDLEKQPKAIQDVLDRIPSKGTRIKPKWLE